MRRSSRGTRAPPAPYVLEPADQRFDTHDTSVNLGVTLFGPANAHLPYLVHALDQAGRNGLTARRVVLDLRDVQAEARGDDAGNQAALGAGTGAGLGAGLGAGIGAGLGAGLGAGDELGENGSGSGGDGDRYGENGGGDAGGGVGHGESSGSHDGIGAEHDGWRTIFEPGGRLSPVAAEHRAPPAPPPAVRVRLLTPLRVKRHEHFVGASDFDFRAFTGGLLRRISLLTYFFGETPLETDFAALLRRAESVPVTGCDLHWRELTRHSSRQRAKLQMGGLIGRFELAGPGLLPFWPLLWLGQWTHAGKGCSMGLGRYVLEPLDGDGAISPPDGASWPAPDPALSLPRSGNLPPLSCRELRGDSQTLVVHCRHSREGGNPREPRRQGNFHTSSGFGGSGCPEQGRGCMVQTATLRERTQPGAAGQTRIRTA